MNRIGLPTALIACLMMIGCGASQPVENSKPEAGESPQTDAADENLTDKGEAAVGTPPRLPYVLREGRGIYRHYCEPCHGAEGGGDGFNAYNLDPRPRGFNDPEFQQDRSDDDLARIIRTGGGAAGLSTGMPPWGRTLNERELGSVLQYVRALGEGETEEIPEP
ncbi:MAG: cytochrome c [Acidobacteria bacterium]|uniref:Cytochrome c n=1 Tax=Candidatus Polarisedimenticola svalbardensis TaxID=2886004 RepID=A0A8J6Y1Y8_9BACT|nr:cytochrome c [Candidatus Polarisedimenticola svalbardensis]